MRQRPVKSGGQERSERISCPRNGKRPTEGERTHGTANSPAILPTAMVQSKGSTKIAVVAAERLLHPILCGGPTRGGGRTVGVPGEKAEGQPKGTHAARPIQSQYFPLRVFRVYHKNRDRRCRDTAPTTTDFVGPLTRAAGNECSMHCDSEVRAPCAHVHHHSARMSGGRSGLGCRGDLSAEIALRPKSTISRYLLTLDLILTSQAKSSSAHAHPWQTPQYYIY